MCHRWLAAGLLQLSVLRYVTNFQRLQRAQNAAARIVRQTPRRQHYSVDLLKDLHWLAVRVGSYKIAVLCYKVAKLQQPSYLTCVLLPYRQSRVLRSCVRPTVNTVFIDKHCCSSVLMLRPTVRNSLPSFVRTADSFTSFRSQLKTYVRKTGSRSAVRASGTLMAATH